MALWAALASLSALARGPERVDVLRIREGFRLTDAVQDSISRRILRVFNDTAISFTGACLAWGSASSHLPAGRLPHGVEVVDVRGD